MSTLSTLLPDRLKDLVRALDAVRDLTGCRSVSASVHPPLEPVVLVNDHRIVQALGGLPEAWPSDDTARRWSATICDPASRAICDVIAYQEAPIPADDLPSRTDIRRPWSRP